MLKESLNNLHQETFHQILERSLNDKFNSRPPKMEISGVLTPVHASVGESGHQFKIVTKSSEYNLKLNSDLLQIAKRILWEEVNAKGVLDVESKIFTVERLSLKYKPDEMGVSAKIGDINFDLDFYSKTISRLGRLEPEPGYFAT
jgi:hypothetical protein